MRGSQREEQDFDTELLQPDGRWKILSCFASGRSSVFMFDVMRVLLVESLLPLCSVVRFSDTRIMSL